MSLAETALPLDAATVTRLLPARPRLLALGEPTHGSDALLAVRNDLFRQLVERHGYRTIAIESDCMMGLIVDAYVAETVGLSSREATSGTATLDDVMERGFSHRELGADSANRELVRWMRSYNEGRPAYERVRFAGFDGPLEVTAAASPRQALTALHTYLAARVDADLLPCTARTLDRLLGADDRWTDPAAMRDPSRSVGRTPAAGQLRLLADDLATLLDTQAPQLDDRYRGRLYSRTATGLLRYHHRMADPSSGRLAHLLSARASMMAANLLALADHVGEQIGEKPAEQPGEGKGEQAGEWGPVFVHAHNGHLQRHKSTMRMGGRLLDWWSAGAIVGTRLGTGYAVLATAVGTIDRHGVGTPPADTVEGILSALPDDRYLVDARRFAAGLGTVTPRVSPWFGYSPLDPAHLAEVDGIVFVRNAGQETRL